jgi:hypothetical protein
MAEEYRPEGAHEKAGPEHEKARNESNRCIQVRREKMFTEKEREHAVKIKVVPLDQRADR